MELSILNFLYLVLIFFSTIIWTLLIIILIRVLKILGPISEMVEIYNKIKKILSFYWQIPENIKQFVMDFFKK